MEIIGGREVTKAHWKPASSAKVCCERGCGQKFSTTQRQVHCRRCGNIFCDSHTQYQRKLSANATPDPVSGVFCRVCRSCFDKGPPGIGRCRDRTSAFRALRADAPHATGDEVLRVLASPVAARAPEPAFAPAEVPKPKEPAKPVGALKSMFNSFMGKKSEPSTPTTPSSRNCAQCGTSFGVFTRRNACDVCKRDFCNACLVRRDTAHIRLGTDPGAPPAAGGGDGEVDEWELLPTRPSLRTCGACDVSVTVQLARTEREAADEHASVALHEALVASRQRLTDLFAHYNDLVAEAQDMPVFLGAGEGASDDDDDFAEAAGKAKGAGGAGGARDRRSGSSAGSAAKRNSGARVDYASAIDYGSEQYRAVSRAQEEILALLRTYQENLSSLKALPATTPTEEKLQKQMARAFGFFISDHVPPFRKLLKEVTHVELTSVTNVSMVLRRLGMEAATIPVFQAVLAEELKGSLAAIRAELERHVIDTGESWQDHAATMDAMVDAWEEMQGPLLRVGDGSDLAVLRACRGVIANAMAQMQAHVGRDRLPRSRGALTRLLQLADRAVPRE